MMMNAVQLTFLFFSLTGSPPFQAPTEEKLYQLIKQGKLDFTHPCWQTINESGINYNIFKIYQLISLMVDNFLPTGISWCVMI